MNKNRKIILRKRIKDENIIREFEILSEIKLPLPPLEVPIERHIKTLSWTFDLSRDKTMVIYKQLLTLFKLPLKSKNNILYCRIKRTCWYDITFEVYETITAKGVKK